MKHCTFRPPYRECVRIVDIDGTLLAKKEPEHYHETKTLPYAAEMVKYWYNKGDYILIWTARDESLREFTKQQLKESGILYHQLLMNKPWTHNMHIYDDWAPVSHKIDRSKGIGEMIELAKQYNEGHWVYKEIDECDMGWFDEALEIVESNNLFG